MAAAALAFGLVGAVQANTITAQGNDGNIYSLDVTTGVATELVSLSKQGDSVFSPNGLGFQDGVYFRSNFDSAGNKNFLYAGDNNLGEIPASGSAIAAADVSGGTYYYVDGLGNFRSVSNIFGVLDTSAPPIALTDGTSTTLGDLAILGGMAYVSYSQGGTHSFVSVNLATNTVTSSTTTSQRYAGLAFTESGALYGFAAAPTDGSGASNGIGIFQIGLDGSESQVATISGLPAGVLLTDAARSFTPDTEITPIPIPAGVWLLLGGLGALAAVRRRRRTAA